VNEALRFQPDHILLSYHGLPIRHMKKISRACAGQGDCSLQTTAENQNCYRRQCYLTSKLIGEGLKRELGWSAEQLAVGFQSRLDNRWIRPFSDDFYRDLPKQGVKRLLVACPSFVADCLETLEEVAIRGRDDFRTHGGDDLKLVPCLNDSDDWVKAAADIARRSGLWTKAL
jgi:ferrochelatase